MIQDKSRLMFYKKATTELTLQTTTVIFFSVKYYNLFKVP